jgi:hypothetical protein
MAVKIRLWHSLVLVLVLLATVGLTGSSIDDDPMRRGDPNIVEAQTFGPITWSWKRTFISPAEKEAAEVHERQHRWNFWTADQFFRPCWQLEQWAFRQETPILQRRILELENASSLAQFDRVELRVLRDRLEVAHNISTYPVDAKGYCNASN